MGDDGEKRWGRGVKMRQNCSYLSKGAVNLEKVPDVWELRGGYKTHLGFRRYD